MKLTTTKPKPSKACMLCHFIAGDLNNARHKVHYFLTRKKTPYISAEQYKIPDTQACIKAMALVEKSSPPFLFKHCLRSYAFGIAMAHKVKRKIDNEVFFLGAIMHDLGLTDDFSGENTFEVVGAQAARNFCVNNAINNNKADLIHEMVALHNSVGLAHKLDPEIALLHFGAGADVAGLWIGDIHKRTLEEILSRYSNKGCKEGMINLIHDQVIKKPNSYMATMVELGFLKKMAKVSF